MLTQPLLDKLTQLRLSAFRVALEEQMHNPQYAELPFEDRLGLLVDRECTHRDNNRLKRRLKAARLPLPATMEDLDLSPARGLDRRLVLQLAQGGWIHQHLNILVLGPTGVGKTFLACALADAACRYNFNVRYQRTSRARLHLLCPCRPLDGIMISLASLRSKVDGMAGTRGRFHRSTHFPSCS